MVFWHCFVMVGALVGMDPAGPAVASAGQTPPVPVAPKPRHFIVQLRIIEVDAAGRQTVIAQPVLQTTGTATGVTVTGENGREFEVHFAASDTPPETRIPTAHTSAPELETARVSVGPSGNRPSADALISVKAVQQPGQTVLRDVARQAGLVIVMERQAAEIVTERLSTPIDLELKNVPVDEVLERLVTPLALEYTLRNDLVLIGFRQPDQSPALKSAPAVHAPVPPPSQVEPLIPLPAKVPLPAHDWHLKVYGVSDLLPPESSGGRDFEPLIQQIQSEVEPESWGDLEGEGTIRGFDSTRSLVVRQSSAGHAALAEYLDRLRRKQK